MDLKNQTKKERDELKKKLNQHKNEINNPCIKVGMRGCNIKFFVVMKI